MPTLSFDIKAVEKELQGMFHQGFLSGYPGSGYEERDFDHKHEEYCWAITRAMEAYSDAIQEQFEFRFDSRYTDKTFYITSTASRPDLLSYYKNIHMGQIISESAIQDVEKDSKLAAIIKHVSVFSEERSSRVGISIRGYIEPRPENFRCYILTADFNCKVRKWYNSAAAEYAKDLTEKFKQIVTSSKPK